MSYNAITDYYLDPVESTAEPVTLQFIKDYAKIDYSTDDNLLSAMIPAARLRLEEYMNMSFFNRKVKAKLNNGSGGILLPFGPIVDPSTIEIFDNAAQAFDATEIKVSGIQFFNLISPAVCGLTVEYMGGFEADKLPANYKIAVAAQVLYMTENRGEEINQDLTKICPVAKQLLQAERLGPSFIIY